MFPLISEIVYSEGQLQKEVIETLSNPHLFEEEELPIIKCLNYYFPEFKFAGRTKEILFNIYSLYEIVSFNKSKYNKEIAKLLQSNIEEFDLAEFDTLSEWAYGPWFKEVNYNSDTATKVNYAVAAAIRTELDVFISTDRINAALELKLRSDFVDKFLIYQPWRQLFQLYLLNLLYGREDEQCFLYLVTMKDDKQILERVIDRYPEYISHYIKKENIKVLSWNMILNWIDKEGSKKYKSLIAVCSRLEKYYIKHYKKEQDEYLAEVSLPAIIKSLNIVERKTTAGHVIEYKGEGLIWLYPEEIDISFPVLDNYFKTKWIPEFEKLDFTSTAKKTYWKYSYKGSIPSEVERKLIKFIKDLYD